MIRNESEAREYVLGLGDTSSVARLDQLAAELEAENQRQNLVSKGTMSDVWTRHFADSAQLLPLATNSGPWVDLGSGAGFPGLVVATLRPEIQVTLVESRARRVEWLSRMIEVLELPNCRVEGQRLEKVATFDSGVISARAFAPLDRLLGLSARFSTSSTCWLLPKGRSAAQEVQALPTQRRSMFHVEQSLTDSDAGIIVGQGKWSGKP